MTSQEFERPRFALAYDVSTNDLIAQIAILIGRHIEQLIFASDVQVILCSLVGIAQRENLDFLECCEAAWLEIKDRKGRMVERSLRRVRNEIQIQ